MIEDIE